MPISPGKPELVILFPATILTAKDDNSCVTLAIKIRKQVSNSMAIELFFVLSALSQKYFMISCL
jgi:hypothetical protein